jgi:carbamoyl-phosphate synthase large subunit
LFASGVSLHLKSRTGSGSKNIFIINNTKEALILLEKYPDSIYQELLLPENKEITCAVYRNGSGQIWVLQLLRRLAGGSTSWAKVIKNDDVEMQCKEIALKLDLQGSMNIQMRVTSKGPRIFEINPRFSSTVLMRHRAGFTDVLWSLDEIENNPVVYQEVPEDTILLRKHDGLIARV